MIHNPDKPPREYTLTDQQISERKGLATEIILTSGVLTYDDVAAGEFSAERPAPDSLHMTIMVLAVNVVVGGLNGATADSMTAGLHDLRIRAAASEAMWNAVAQVLVDSSATASNS